MFLIDIVLIFNIAFYNEEYKMIKDRKNIARNYLSGWFLIDVLAIIPFDLLFGGNGGVNNLVRIARLGKMYKLVKLTKLLRVAKVVRDKTKFTKFFSKFVSIKLGVQRQATFILSVFIMIHIVACLWIMTASVNETTEGTWMEGEISEYEPSQIYLTSVYFTVTTITTVGYGDVSISTPLEKIFCIFSMILGVLSFSFATGSLSSILSIYDF
jgi:hypothetical protein